MLEQIVAFAEELIRIPTDPGNTRELHTALDAALSRLSGYTIEHFEKDGVKSALVFNTPHRPKVFSLLLNSHLDSIPGKAFQYFPERRGNRLYGVGAMDMKANLACAVFAFQEVAKKIKAPVALQLVTDEEIGGFLGTKYQVEQGVRADFVLATEPTNFHIVHKAKGVLWLNISCTGKTAHGAYPWRGENALWKMHRFLAEVERVFPPLTEQKWETSLNWASLETTNKSLNKIPDDCRVQFDIRCIPEDCDTALEKIRNILPSDFSLEILAKESALFVDEAHPFLQKIQKITKNLRGEEVRCYGAQGTSDARHFAAAGMSGIEFGPIGEGIGTDEEWVDIPSLEQYYKILKEVLRSCDE